MLQGHFPAARHCLLVIYQIKQSLYGLPGISEKDSFRTIEVQRVIDQCSSGFLLKNYMIYIYMIYKKLEKLRLLEKRQ